MTLIQKLKEKLNKEIIETSVYDTIYHKGVCDAYSKCLKWLGDLEALHQDERKEDFKRAARLFLGEDSGATFKKKNI